MFTYMQLILIYTVFNCLNEKQCTSLMFTYMQLILIYTVFKKRIKSAEGETNCVWIICITNTDLSPLE